MGKVAKINGYYIQIASFLLAHLLVTTGTGACIVVVWAQQWPYLGREIKKME
jgi:hypothetical protein